MAAAKMHLPHFYNATALLERLLAAHKEGETVVFLVGSPITAPEKKNLPGVPGVKEMIELVLQQLGGSDVSELNKETTYQDAFQMLLGNRGIGRINKLVRDAVLMSYISEGPALKEAKDGKQSACDQLESDVDGWALRPAVEYLGKILVRFPTTFGRVILTTNFDPLISVSIRRAGGRAWRTVLTGDGSLEESIAEGCRVVHLHGYWDGKTESLHTPAQLSAERPLLKGALTRLFHHSLLVVVAYGGWDDVVTKTLISLVRDGGAFPEILWTFNSSRPTDVMEAHGNLINSLAPGIGRGRVLLYGGIDCHDFFKDLWRILARYGSKHEASNPAKPEPNRWRPCDRVR